MFMYMFYIIVKLNLIHKFYYGRNIVVLDSIGQSFDRKLVKPAIILNTNVGSIYVFRGK